MSLGNLYQSIADRYARINESLAKGISGPTLLRDATRYAWPQFSKDASTIIGLGMATREGIANRQADIDYDKKRIRFVISTQNVDRDGDIVVSRGISVHNYRKNPQWSFGHWSWDLSPAKMTDPEGNLCIYYEDRRVLADAWFDPKDSDAMILFDKYADGYMSATSISFVPMLAYPIERANHDSRGIKGYEFPETDLTEVALVNTPSNPEAIRDFMDQQKGHMTPKLYNAFDKVAAKPKGRCFTGYCPCPPCEETMTTLTSGLPGSKKKKKCACGGKCARCKEMTPGANSGEAAANNPQEEHTHEEESTSHVHEDARAKLPKLIEAGYPRDVACCMAVHMAHAGSKGEDIEGHEGVAEMYKDMGESSGDDGGYAGGEEMSLKSFVKSITKGEEMERDEVDERKSEDKPAETEAHSEEGEEEPHEEEAVESGPKFKESAMVLGNMHNHMKAAHEYLSKTLPTMDHEQIAKAMESHLPDLEGHMGDYEKLVTKHHKGVKMEALCKHCKSLAEGDPEQEVVNNQTGREGEDDASSNQPKRDTGGDKSGTDLMRENQEVKLSPAAVAKGHDVLDKLDGFLFSKTGQHV